MRGLNKLNFRRGRVSLAATDRESGFYDFLQFKIHEFY